MIIEFAAETVRIPVTRNLACVSIIIIIIIIIIIVIIRRVRWKQFRFRCVVCPSVTLMHPAKTVGRNNMPFDRDACVVPSNIELDEATVPHGKRRFEIAVPISQWYHL